MMKLFNDNYENIYIFSEYLAKLPSGNIDENILMTYH